MRTRVAVLATTAGVLGAVLAYGLSQRNEARCEYEADKLGGAWGPTRRERVRAAFLATGSPHAASAWEKVATELDAHATQWRAMRTEACLSARESPTSVAWQTAACLDTRLWQLAAVTNVLEKADAQTVRNAGQLLSSPRTTLPPERRRMGMVFQNYAVWPHMSVFDNVAFGLKVAKFRRAQIRERVASVLAALGLDGLEGRNPAQLSGGQQQRVALARSLVVEPSILLLDEPLSNLDAKLRERMRSELKSLQRRTGITFVYVTHDQAEAMALSDRIAVFDQGVLQQYGRPREIYERPANLFVADFMGIVNRLPGEIVERDDGRVRVRVGDHVLAAIAPAAAAGSSRQVTLAIRPESIRLGEPATDRPGNRLAGSAEHRPAHAQRAGGVLVEREGGGRLKGGHRLTD